MNTDQFQLRSTLTRLKILWRYTSPRQLIAWRPNMIIMCKTVHFKLATLSDCLFWLQESWNQGGRGVGGARSNPSRDPTPRRLMMAEHHRLYTSTDYNAKSNPNSEYHPDSTNIQNHGAMSWTPPSVEHEEVMPEESPPQPQYPIRHRQPPDRLQF